MSEDVTNRFISVATGVGWVCGVLAAISVAGLMLLTVSDIFLRFLFNKPINGSFELAEYFMVPIVFFAIPWATVRGTHVRVDLFTAKLSKRKQGVLYAVSCLVSAMMALFYGWYTYPEVRYNYEVGFKSDMLDIPAYPFYFIIMVGFFLLFFTLLAVFIQYIKQAVKK